MTRGSSEKDYAKPPGYFTGPALAVSRRITRLEIGPERAALAHPLGQGANQATRKISASYKNEPCGFRANVDFSQSSLSIFGHPGLRKAGTADVV